MSETSFNYSHFFLGRGVEMQRDSSITPTEFHPLAVNSLSALQFVFKKKILLVATIQSEKFVPPHSVHFDRGLHSSVFSVRARVRALTSFVVGLKLSSSFIILM